MTDSMLETDPKQRFSNRVEDYVRYRPGYPREILDVLRNECGFTTESVVADIGSGTGFLTQLFLENGNLVYGVEPNGAMRAAGEEFLKKYPRFHSVDGSAEATTLADASADFIVAGQAFHWFDPKAAATEFRRVLRPLGWVAVIWNERKKEDTGFQRDYEQLLRTWGTDYEKVAATYPKKSRVENFLDFGAVWEKSFPNEQTFDFEGLRGRSLSSSFSPPEGHPKHEPMIAELKRLFEVYARDGRVRFDYETHMYYGRLDARRS
jgi:SAM-dependent methyltransferase